MLLITSVGLVKAELLQNTAGDQQTDSVGGRPVSETVLDAVAGQLVGVGSSQNDVTGDLGRNDLGNNVLLGETDNQPVLGAVVLGLVLGDQPLAGVVVSLTFTTTTERSLETRVVRSSLLDLLERHGDKDDPSSGKCYVWGREDTYSALSPRASPNRTNHHKSNQCVQGVSATFILSCNFGNPVKERKKKKVR